MEGSIALHPRLRALARLPGHAGRWWMQELRALVPERAFEWLAGARNRWLVVAVEDDAVVLRLFGGGSTPTVETRTARAAWSGDAVDAFLKPLRLRRNDIAVGLRLPADRFFPRRVVLPAATRGRLDEILSLDLTRRTPFKLDDVYHDHFVGEPEPGKLVVRQWIVRRAFVHEAVSELALHDLSFVEGLQPGQEAPRVRLRTDAKTARSWTRRAFLGLLIVTAMAALAAGGLRHARQQAVIGALESRLAATRVKAQQVRAVMTRLEQSQALVRGLRARRIESPGLLDVWQEATGVLPSHSWLSELRLIEASDRQAQRVVMTGFSTAASTLVPLIDRSPVFTDAALTAPVTLDPVEQRERFSLQARIRQQATVRSAAK